MRFRKVVARWDEDKNKGIVKYQLGEIIVTCQNEDAAGSFDAHFWIPGIIDRHVMFTEKVEKNLYQYADESISKIIYQRIEKWYPMEVMIPEELITERKQEDFISDEDYFEYIEKRRNELERIEKEWTKKINDYKQVAWLWERETKKKNSEDFEMDIMSTEDGVIVLTRQKIDEGNISHRLYSLQDEQQLFQTIQSDKKMELEDAIVYHFKNIRLDRTEKRHWEKFVHRRLKNYDQLLEEELRE